MSSKDTYPCDSQDHTLNTDTVVPFLQVRTAAMLILHMKCDSHHDMSAN